MAASTCKERGEGATVVSIFGKPAVTGSTRLLTEAGPTEDVTGGAGASFGGGGEVIAVSRLVVSGIAVSGLAASGLAGAAFSASGFAGSSFAGSGFFDPAFAISSSALNFSEPVVSEGAGAAALSSPGSFDTCREDEASGEDEAAGEDEALGEGSRGCGLCSGPVAFLLSAFSNDGWLVTGFEARASGPVAASAILVPG